MHKGLCSHETPDCLLCWDERSGRGRQGQNEGREGVEGGLWAAVQNRNWAINADFPPVWWVKGGEGEMGGEEVVYWSMVYKGCLLAILSLLCFVCVHAIKHLALSFLYCTPGSLLFLAECKQESACNALVKFALSGVMRMQVICRVPIRTLMQLQKGPIMF